MALDKAIEHGKEKRKQYYGAKAIDGNCRNHGSCNHCKGNRLHKHEKKISDFREYFNEQLANPEAKKIYDDLVESMEEFIPKD
jgi:hypothetical protein